MGALPFASVEADNLVALSNLMGARTPSVSTPLLPMAPVRAQIKAVAMEAPRSAKPLQVESMAPARPLVTAPLVAMAGGPMRLPIRYIAMAPAITTPVPLRPMASTVAIAPALAPLLRLADMQAPSPLARQMDAPRLVVVAASPAVQHSPLVQSAVVRMADSGQPVQAAPVPVRLAVLLAPGEAAARPIVQQSLTPLRRLADATPPVLRPMAEGRDKVLAGGLGAPLLAGGTTLPMASGGAASPGAVVSSAVAGPATGGVYRGGPAGGFSGGLAAGSAGDGAVAAASPSTVAAAPSPGSLEEMLLQFDVDQKVRLEIFTAYRVADGRIFLPLDDVMKALGLPVAVDADGGGAHGWFMRRNQTFNLDVAHGTVEIAGKTAPLDRANVLKADNKLLVAASQVEAWFPVKFDLSYNNLTLYATATETLPMEAREARYALWEAQSKTVNTLTGPRTVLPRSLASMPNIRLSTGSAYNHNDNGGLLSNNATLQAQGGMAYADTNITLGLQSTMPGDVKLSAANILLSRQDSDGNLLGPLHARKVEAGDVNLPSVPLLPAGTQGRGVVAGNLPAGFAGSNSFQLVGHLPVGWDVEVYQNNNLQTFATVGADGQYRFTDLNLQPGMNEFRLVGYGPNGEREERVERFYLSPGMVDPGKWVYEAGATQSAQPLIPTASAPSGNLDGTGAVNAYYGLTRNVTLAVGAAHGPMGSDHTSQGGVSVGTRTAFGRTYGQMDLASIDGGWAYQSNQQMRLGKNTNVGLHYTRLVSDTLRTGATQSEWGGLLESDARLGLPVHYGFTFSHRTIAGTAAPENLLGMKQSWNLGPVAFTNTLDRRLTENPGWQNGNLTFASSVYGHPYRGTVQYDPDYAELVRQLSLESQWNLNSNNVLGLIATYQTEPALAGVQADLHRKLGTLDLGLHSSLRTDLSYEMGVNAAMQFVPDLNSKTGYKAAATGEGFDYGSADVRVFVDDNANGVYDPGEELMAGVNVVNAQSNRKVKTNKQGVARLIDLVPYSDVPVQVAEDSLPDVYLKAVNGTQILVANKGYGGMVDLPLVRFGEISGMLSAPGNAGFGSLELWLQDKSGKVVAKAGVETDGYFLFENVPMGGYTLTVNPATLPPHLHLQEQPAVELTKANPESGNVHAVLNAL